jgi:hypothetical protein
VILVSFFRVLGASMNIERQRRLAALAFVVGEHGLARIVRATREVIANDPKKQTAWQLRVLGRAAEEECPWLIAHVQALVDPRARKQKSAGPSQRRRSGTHRAGTSPHH